MSEHSAEKGLLTNAEIEALADAFVAANRAEFLDWAADGVDSPDDPDLPILRAIEAVVRSRMVQAWHEGYGAGSSNATDGWLNPGSPRTTNPYVLPPDDGREASA